MSAKVQPELALAAARRTPGPAGLRERVLARATRPGWEPWRERVAALWDVDAAVVQGVFERAQDDSAWTDSPIPTVRAFHLEGGPSVADADVGLVRIPGGFRFPEHTHTETEEYVVLQGVMRFADGHREHPGDRVRNDGSVRHSYVAEGDVIVALVMRGELG